MKEITYRKLIKSDYASIKKLICEAFGFDEFIKDKKVLDSVLSVYLQNCIMDSTFSNVAVKDNKVIGLILGDTKNDKKKLKKFHNISICMSDIIKLAFSNKENKKLIKEFSKITNTYKEIIKGKEHNFQGSIQLFIVSKESRGFGVGKHLVSNLFDYMKNRNVKSLYLYTDTRCNFGFYDSQNFNRINEKQVVFDTLNETIDVYLYGYLL